MSLMVSVNYADSRYAECRGVLVMIVFYENCSMPYYLSKLLGIKICVCRKRFELHLRHQKDNNCLHLGPML
jgi:hypothetical protein